MHRTFKFAINSSIADTDVGTVRIVLDILLNADEPTKGYYKLLDISTSTTMQRSQSYIEAHYDVC